MSDAEAARRYRDQNECSLQEAVRAIRKNRMKAKYEHLQNKLRHSRCWEDVRDVLEEVIFDRIVELT
jgi:UDP:flavonoid glycosyltransferase YjiC (YdhE family)